MRKPKRQPFVIGEEQLRLIIEAAPSGMLMVDDNGEIVLVNSQIERLFEYSRGELLGQSIEILVPEAVRDKYPNYRESFNQLTSAGSVDIVGDLVGMKKDGSQISLEIRVGMLHIEEQTCLIASVVNITDRRQAELDERTKQLAEETEKVAAASKLKSEFLANMSHEIRTPMNAVIGMCNHLLRTTLDEKQCEYAENIRDGANALLTVINDILDFSKIEAGKLELEVVDFDPVRMVESTCELLATSARAKQLSLMSFVDPALSMRLRGDPERLRQIIINLLSNAIKFSNQGSVTVRAEIDSSDGEIVNVRYTVSDTGIGMTAETQARLFQPFVQADGSISRRFGGTGLGLSICKHLIDLMNGTIEVESSPGEGATFTFIVPLEKRSTLPITSIQERLRDVRLLIVEDEPEVRHILKSYTESWGMRAEFAATGKDAMRQLRRGYVDGDPFKLAIVDYKLPERSGLELAQEVSQDAAIAPTKMIMITAFDTAGLSKKASDAGFKAFLTKPVRQSQVLEAVVAAYLGNEPQMSSSALQGLRERSPSQPFRTGVILIAEDNRVNQQVAQLYLDHIGFESHVVSNGQEAIDALFTNDYALVLMDCQMPELDGLAATKAIREREQDGRHTTIVAMTAHAMEGDRERCLAAGMDDYISKPIDPDQLAATIERWLPRQAELVYAAKAKTAGNSAQSAGSTAAGLPSNVIDLPTLTERYKDIAGQLIKLFLDDVPQKIEKLRESITSSAESDVLAVAHSIKGASATICANQITDICISLEEAARDENWSRITELVSRLEQTVQSAKEETRAQDEDTASSASGETPPEPISVLIAEDQQVTRVGLRAALSRHADIKIVEETDNGKAAIEATLHRKPKVVLMDIGLPLVDGIDAAREIKKVQPETAILMLTSRDHDSDVFAALFAGADGYCLKESSAEQIVNAIRTVSEGTPWMDPAIANRALSNYSPVESQASQKESASRKSKSARSQLTDRELEVLTLIVRGLSNKDIAETLNLSLDTVKNHMRYIFAKLTVSDRTQAAVKALKEGLV